MAPAPTRTLRTKYGFTTIELMVVLVIMVVMSTVAVVAIGPVLRNARMHSACRTIISLLKYARSHAVASGEATRVVFANGRVFLSVNDERVGRVHTLPDGVGVDDSEDIEFTPLGRSKDVVIEVLDRDGKHKYILVDSITGRCRLQDELEQND